MSPILFNFDVMRIKRKAFSILAIVIIAFVFLAIIGISFIFSSISEKRQLSTNINNDKARALAMAALDIALYSIISEVNSQGTHTFKWFRNKGIDSPSDRMIDVSTELLDLFPEDKSDIKIEKVRASLIAIDRFPDSEGRDNNDIEKRGILEIKSRASFKGSKKQIIAGYDFKTVQIKLSSVDGAGLNKFLFFVRDRRAFLDGLDVNTPEFDVVDNEKRHFLYFGNINGDSKDGLSGGDGYMYYKNTKFKNITGLRVLYNKDSLTNLTDISVDWNNIPFSKVGRWFTSGGGSDFIRFYVKGNSAVFEGINLVEGALKIGAVRFGGCSMIYTLAPVLLKGPLLKEDNNDYLIIDVLLQDQNMGSIYIMDKTIHATLSALYGGIIPKSTNRKVNVLGSMLAKFIKRVKNNKPINGLLVRDPALDYIDDTSNLINTYSVAISRCPSYYIVTRYYD